MPNTCGINKITKITDQQRANFESQISEDLKDGHLDKRWATYNLARVLKRDYSDKVADYSVKDLKEALFNTYGCERAGAGSMNVVGHFDIDDFFKRLNNSGDKRSSSEGSDNTNTKEDKDKSTKNDAAKDKSTDKPDDCGCGNDKPKEPFVKDSKEPVKLADNVINPRLAIVDCFDSTCQADIDSGWSDFDKDGSLEMSHGEAVEGVFRSRYSNGEVDRYKLSVNDEGNLDINEIQGRVAQINSDIDSGKKIDAVNLSLGTEAPFIFTGLDAGFMEGGLAYKEDLIDDISDLKKERCKLKETNGSKDQARMKEIDEAIARKQIEIDEITEKTNGITREELALVRGATSKNICEPDVRAALLKTRTKEQIQLFDEIEKITARGIPVYVANGNIPRKLGFNLLSLVEGVTTVSGYKSETEKDIPDERYVTADCETDELEQHKYTVRTLSTGNRRTTGLDFNNDGKADLVINKHIAAGRTIDISGTSFAAPAFAGEEFKKASATAK